MTISTSPLFTALIFCASSLHRCSSALAASRAAERAAESTGQSSKCSMPRRLQPACDQAAPEIAAFPVVAAPEAAAPAFAAPAAAAPVAAPPVAAASAVAAFPVAAPAVAAPAVAAPAVAASPLAAPHPHGTSPFTSGLPSAEARTDPPPRPASTTAVLVSALRFAFRCARAALRPFAPREALAPTGGMPPAFPTNDADFDAMTEEGYSNAARQLSDMGYDPVEAHRAIPSQLSGSLLTGHRK